MWKKYSEKICHVNMLLLFTTNYGMAKMPENVPSFTNFFFCRNKDPLFFVV